MIKFHESNIKRAIKHLFKKRDLEQVILFPHMGLGDHLVCIGLIRDLINRGPNKTYYYACSRSNFHTIAWIYKDINNVLPVSVRDRKEAIQLSGFLNAQFLPIDTDGLIISNYEEYFYQKFSVPFELRWSNAAVPAGPNSEKLYQKLNPQNEPYLLVCSQQSNNINYDLRIQNPKSKKLIYVNPITNNLYDWIKLTHYADEIHSIDTSYIHLVESYFYQQKHPSLFFHQARPTKTRFTRKLNWTDISY